MMLRPTKTLAVALILLIAIPAYANQVYLGPSDVTGRPSLSPLTEEELQHMIEQRTEMHPSKFKSRSRLPGLSQSANPFDITVPTANMYDYDVLHYKLDIEVDMAGETIDGYMETRLKSLTDGLSFVDLTLNEYLSVTDVSVNGSSQSFSHSTHLMTVFLDGPFDTDEEFTVRIEYNGYPGFGYLFYGGGMFFAYWESQKVAFTFAEPFGAKGWFPCKDFPFDKPDSMDITITYPTVFESRPLTCASNGLLLSVTDNGDGTTTSHWSHKYPIATYLVAVCISEYDVIEQTWEYAPGEFMPIMHFHSPGIPPDAMWGSTYFMVNFTVPSMEALTHYWGIYPFVEEKYGHMQDLAGGAMEHQTCTSINGGFNTEWVIAHELAHQWAGDQVTCSPFNHMWLNEGFASYSEVLYIEYWYGWPSAQSYLYSQHHIDASTPYVENLHTDNVFDGTTVYDKGSWLVHMLRNQMGDSLFFPAMQYFFHDSEFAGAGACTEDLCSVVSDFYGSDMSWFFDAWVYQEGQPNYRYFWDYEPDPVLKDGYHVRLYLEQINDDGVFPMNVEIAAQAGDLDTLLRVWNGTDGKLYEFHLPNPPDTFVIDPYGKILKRTNRIEPGLRIVTDNIPDAIIGQPISITFEANWGVPDYHWEKTLGQFPFGMTFNEETGVLSGTPSWESECYFRLRCTDSDSPSSTHERGFVISIIQPPPMCGDCNGSGEIDLDDVVYIVNFIFNGGAPPDPMEVGDVDATDTVDIDDAVYLIHYLFTGGPAPIA